jgi:hypothetical protein
MDRTAMKKGQGEKCRADGELGCHSQGTRVTLRWAEQGKASKTGEMRW